jgi:hypothetical protein
MPINDKKFASRVDWNLMRTFVDIVRAGESARQRDSSTGSSPASAPRSSGWRKAWAPRCFTAPQRAWK